jgi:ankyrin repeat protein
MAWATDWSRKTILQNHDNWRGRIWQHEVIQIMKTKLYVLIFLLVAALAQAQTNDLTALLQQGLFEEQANQNLDAAIADYSSLAKQFDKDRQLAATAVFRIGECYRMQGRTNEAAAQYQRILHEFSDQQMLATLSRQNLAGLGRLGGDAAGIPSSQPSSSPNPELTRELQLVKKLQAMPIFALIQVAPTLLTDATLNNLINQYNQCDLDLLRLRVDHSSDDPEVKRILAIQAGMSEKIRERLEGLSQALALDLASAGNIELTTTSSDGGFAPVPDDEDREIQLIQQMIQNSPDLINVPGENGRTPLADAAVNGWLKVATYLLDHGADVNVGTALNAAAAAGNRAMVELLLSRCANVNSKDGGGATPLWIAVNKNYPSVIEVLLANKADVNVPDNSGNTPLLTAAGHGQVKIAQTLLAAGADPNMETNQGRTPLSFAAGSGSPETVKLLLDAKADPNGGKLDAPLLAAIHKKDIASAELLLLAGANPETKGAVDWGINIGGEQYYGNSDASVTPLFLAIQTKQLPMVQLLLKFKADPNDSQTDGEPLLLRALDEPDILEALLAAGGKVDSRSANGDLLLDYAIGEKYAASVEILLKHGANPNAPNFQGFTPLHYAAGNIVDDKIFELLFDYKADPNVRNDQGRTPLDLLKERLRDLRESSLDSPAEVAINELIDLLHRHGALDKLPDWDRITVSRSSANFSQTVFQKGTNDWNQFTLLETIYAFGQNDYQIPSGWAFPSVLAFADLNHVVVMRPGTHGATAKRIEVNLLNATNGVDLTKDMPLEFGDVVEIPEREHTLAETAIYLPKDQFMTIYNYLRSKAGEAKLIVAGGQTIQLPLQPFNCQIGHVLHGGMAQSVLTSSSDLSRVKVTRRDVTTGKNHEWIVDCSDHQTSSSQFIPQPPSTFQMRLAELNYNANNPQPSSDLWLRDGDVIEVPEKP